MTISLIVAMSRSGVIGREGKLPWHLPEDLRRFKKITMGHPIVMGRRTYESIGKPLPGRDNIVLSRDPHYRPEGVAVVHSFDEILAKEKAIHEVFIIGGSEIFKLALPKADKIYLTLIERDIEGDVFFPELDLEEKFRILSEEGPFISEKERLPYRFITAIRRSSGFDGISG